MNSSKELPPLLHSITVHRCTTSLSTAADAVTQKLTSSQNNDVFSNPLSLERRHKTPQDSRIWNQSSSPALPQPPLLMVQQNRKQTPTNVALPGRLAEVARTNVLHDSSTRIQSLTLAIVISTIFVFMTLTTTAVVAVVCCKQNSVLAHRRRRYPKTESDGATSDENSPSDVERCELNVLRQTSSLNDLCDRETGRLILESDDGCSDSDGDDGSDDVIVPEVSSSSCLSVNDVDEPAERAEGEKSKSNRFQLKSVRFGKRIGRRRHRDERRVNKYNNAGTDDVSLSPPLSNSRANLLDNSAENGFSYPKENDDAIRAFHEVGKSFPSQPIHCLTAFVDPLTLRLTPGNKSNEFTDSSRKRVDKQNVITVNAETSSGSRCFYHKLREKDSSDDDDC